MAEKSQQKNRREISTEKPAEKTWSGGGGGGPGSSMALLISVLVPVFLVYRASTGRHGTGNPYGKLQW